MASEQKIITLYPVFCLLTFAHTMIQLSSLMMAWLGVASLGFSFQSYHWFEIHDLGAPANVTFNTTQFLQVKAHIGLWGACVVPLAGSLAPSPAPPIIPGGGGGGGEDNSPHCKSFQTTNRLNETLQQGNAKFERYFLFPRSFMYLSLLFSIFGAIICSLLISGVGTTTLLDELKLKRFEEPHELLKAAVELRRRNDWMHRSYYLTCLCQSFFVLLGTGSAWWCINARRLISEHTSVNYFPLQSSSTIVSSVAFFPALIGGLAPILSAFTWWCGQLVNLQTTRETTNELLTPVGSPPVNIGNSPTQHERRQQHYHQQQQHRQEEQRQQQQQRRQQQDSYSSMFQTPGGTTTGSRPFPWCQMFRLLPLIIIPVASKTLISSNLPNMLISFFGDYEQCGKRFPFHNQSSLRFTCANDAGSSYKASFDTMSAILSFCVTPFIGALSDRYGRKPLLSMTALTTAVPVVSDLFSLSLFLNNVYTTWYSTWYSNIFFVIYSSPVAYTYPGSATVYVFSPYFFFLHIVRLVY